MSLIRYNNKMMSPGIFDLLNDIFSDDYEHGNRLIRSATQPAVNVKENDKAFELELAVPGMDKKDINIEVDDHVLTISSEKQDEKTEQKDEFRRREFHYSSFKRSFTIPEDIDGQKIEAKYDNGVLKVYIPKKEAKERMKKLIKVA